jgi:hypothetical protein
VGQLGRSGQQGNSRFSVDQKSLLLHILYEILVTFTNPVILISQCKIADAGDETIAHARMAWGIQGGGKTTSGHPPFRQQPLKRL